MSSDDGVAGSSGDGEVGSCCVGTTGEGSEIGHEDVKIGEGHAPLMEWRPSVPLHHKRLGMNHADACATMRPKEIIKDMRFSREMRSSQQEQRAEAEATRDVRVDVESISFRRRLSSMSKAALSSGGFMRY